MAGMGEIVVCFQDTELQRRVVTKKNLKGTILYV